MRVVRAIYLACKGKVFDHVHGAGSHVTFPTVFTVSICAVRYSLSPLLYTLGNSYTDITVGNFAMKYPPHTHKFHIHVHVDFDMHC